MVDTDRFYRFGVNIFCSFSLLAQRKPPSPLTGDTKERAPCHSVLRNFLCFSKGPELEETRFAQTVHELNPDLSAMLDLVAGPLPVNPNFWLGLREAI
jgi:hypothetical protein